MESSTGASSASTLSSVMSVLGPVPLSDLGITDAHNHVWIERVPGAAPDAPVLTQREAVLEELKDYRQAGGSALLDCQPGGCGRSAGMLAELSRASGVTIICATGFHRRRYYAPDFWLWNASPGDAAEYFTAELLDGTTDTLEDAETVRAGFIKVACEATLSETPLNALEGAAQAAYATGAVIEIHTEKGAAAEEIFEFLTCRGVAPRQVVLCHIDKRPDFAMHRDLVQAGALLEYDTFYRPRYEPERNLWPLLETMASAGLDHGIALATDMAEAALWTHLGGGPGLTGFVEQIGGRLRSLGLSQEAIARMLGGNITNRLAK